MSTTVLLVDDHQIMRDGLRAVIEKEPELKVVGESPAWCKAWKMVCKAGPTESTVLILGRSGTGKVNAAIAATVRSVTRIDPATGARRALREGRLDDLDRCAWFSDRVLRWRSRLPDDPPYEDTEIVNDLAYSLYGALVETGGHYALHHDFAFAERPGAIEDVAVTLRIDPAWRVDGPREQTFHGGRLPPGQGYVVRTALEWSGAGEPALQRTSPRQARLMLALAGVPLLLVILLLVGEWSPPMAEKD